MPVLLFTVVAAMSALAPRLSCLARTGEARPSLGLLAIFWTALAGGILIKGPLILMVVGLAAATLVILDRSARWLLALRPLPGSAWLFLLVLPWFIAIYARVGTQFLIDSVGDDMFAKVANPQETHGAPPGLYLILFFVTFFPASILAGPRSSCDLGGPSRARRALSPGVARAVLDRIRGGHYQATALCMPLYPAIAILIAGAVEIESAVAPAGAGARTMSWFLVPVIVSIIAIVAAIIISRTLCSWLRHSSPALSSVAYSPGNCSTMTAPNVPSCGDSPSGPDGDRHLRRRRAGADAGVRERGARRSAWVMRPARIRSPPVSFRGASLVFLAGATTHLPDAAGAADFLRRPLPLRLHQSHQERAFALRAEAIGMRYIPDRVSRLST